MERIRTFVCPGRWDEKTKQIKEMHGGWQNTTETDKCKRCGQDALHRADEDYLSIPLPKPGTMSTRG